MSLREQELGRRRLAMRLPKIRSRIMLAAAPWQLDLFEAYERAVSFREIMRLSPSQDDLFAEYAKTCLHIERDILCAMTEKNLRSEAGAARLDGPGP